MSGRVAHEISQDRIYTMRQLNQHTADVLREINERGATALITRHGRFVAAIVPLATANLESRYIEEILQETKHRAKMLGVDTLDEIHETDTLRNEMNR